MANTSDVLKMLSMLVDANLSFPPRDIEATARVWGRMLQDIPAEYLHQAAEDHILSASEFPKLAEIRKLAENVKVHNGASAAGGQFKDDTRTAKTGEVPGVWRVIAPGSWEIFVPDPDFIPDDKEYPMIDPPAHPLFQSWAAAQKWQENEIHQRGKVCWHEKNYLPTDAELAEIDAMREGA